MSSSFRRANRPRQNAANGEDGFTAASFPQGKYSQVKSTSPFKRSTVLERVGTKPSKGGLTLTSSGLRELDAIIGGGQPLGTAMLIEEDRWTQDLALALVRYWCAEAVSQEQNLLLVSTAPSEDISDLSRMCSISENDFNIQQQGMSVEALQSLTSLLPKNLHLEKFRNKSKPDISNANAGGSSTPMSTPSITTQKDFAIIEEEEDFDEEGEDDGMGTTEEKGDEMLQNAWQYKVSVQRERRAEHATSSSSRTSSKAGSKVYCHSYDLSGKMEDQYPQNWGEEGSRISAIDCSYQQLSFSCSKATVRSGIHLYQKCLGHIHETLSRHPNGVVRMLLMNAPIHISAIALPLLLSYIRSHSLPVVILVTVRPWIWSSTQAGSSQSLISLRHTCDAVFTCEGFDAIVTPPPTEFSDLAGIFSIQKMAMQSQSHFADSTTNRRPPANRFGMKRDRRKLHIRMLHLPPEDFSAGGSSVGSGVRSGGGRQSQKETGSSNSTALQPGLGCSSNLRGKTSSTTASLDF
mmetsp:Transcript_6126/g.9250  ORF Transcript_6126/g.9250 Transcript_6126/m.9250 type:complete len:520 (+) Transcript_6126:60-1619(+)|eukprot:CAMPEP_0203663492 /NCGR_PEP_ID=MMETSP0090-20130426/1066_1 /ASSEMBLY_ACC=CAM_ASM_001088 /TAXON_ID=426623 /ORGANISM="Chaetoceros affinis, Strain CCMP159" /LENGTH=519 /DNA_ID=CAMNT_0050526419 /DNA_START=54 /DNA_END=1613 /DNA_ORIENTATION=+